MVGLTVSRPEDIEIPLFCTKPLKNSNRCRRFVAFKLYSHFEGASEKAQLTTVAV